MRYVLDASVLLKWLFQDAESESSTHIATRLVSDILTTNSVETVQPVHWLAEVGGVLARKAPQTIETSLQLLADLEWPVADDTRIMQCAGRLAVQLDHHLFDTLYHAVALTQHAVLVTADYRYLAKASHLGHIRGLDNVYPTIGYKPKQ